MTGAELLAWLQSLPAEELELMVVTPDRLGEGDFTVATFTDTRVGVRVVSPGWTNKPKKNYIVIEKES